MYVYIPTCTYVHLYMLNAEGKDREQARVAGADELAVAEQPRGARGAPGLLPGEIRISKPESRDPKTETRIPQPATRNHCVKSLRSSYTGLYPQKLATRNTHSALR